MDTCRAILAVVVRALGAELGRVLISAFAAIYLDQLTEFDDLLKFAMEDSSLNKVKSFTEESDL